MIVALAGHVDHGKTSLVHALSGVNTDRLQEEQQRGLTIDLGFAYIDDGAIGFVDVPGHHKFIHNMVAGVAADQIAMLVIAADDGPMPQSQEHLDILKLLGITDGLVVITKADRVQPERLDACQKELDRLLGNTFLQDAPRFVTSIEQAAGYEPLLAYLRQQAAERSQTIHGSFRLAIDRAFTVKGSGVVITGTIHSGQVQKEQTLHHFPSGSEVRVRGLRAQDQEVDEASQGERCAINISGIDLDQVKRGDWLSAAPASAYREASIMLTVLDNFPRQVKQWTPVHVYHATSHATGHIALLSDQRLNPGEQALVDLVLGEPLALQHDDQLVLRDQGLDTTLGGGSVIYAATTTTNRRRNAQRIERVRAFTAGEPADVLQGLLAGGQPVELASFSSFWQLTKDTQEKLLSESEALQLNGFAITKATLGALAKDTIAELTHHGNERPDSTGLKENEFASLPKTFAASVLGALVQTGKVLNTNGSYSLAGHQAALPETLQPVFDKVGRELDLLQPPSAGDLAKKWRRNVVDVERDLKELSKRGLLVYIAEHRYFLPARLNEIVGIVKQMAAQGPFSVKQFRDQTGIGRNVAIDILEYFDSKGFTRRQDNHRVLLRDTL